MRNREVWNVPSGALLFGKNKQQIVKTKEMFVEARCWYINVKPIHSKRKAYITSHVNLQRIPITEENLKKLGFREVTTYNHKALRYKGIRITFHKNLSSQRKGPDYMYIRAVNNKYLSNIELDIRYIDELQTVLRAIKMKYPKMLVNQ